MALYNRLALSRDEEKVKELSLEMQITEKPKDFIKDPYILKFLGREQLLHYYENQFEILIEITLPESIHYSFMMMTKTSVGSFIPNGQILLG